ncbi:MAG: hypothetical protein GTO02_17495 [Candidatus Dadabacteria bacterium]|nr:hypothetical protein [Candidatus Dadabacteria bacterium]
MEECKKLFGGCIKRGSKVHKQCWAWKLSSRSAYIFLNAIYPYSKIKKRQIEIALEYVRLFKNKNSWGNRGMPESQKAQRRMYAKRLSEMKLEDDFSRR